MTRQAFTARAYQGDIIDHLLNNPRCAAWAGMGLGKTVSTLTALDALEFIDPGPSLVLAPKRVAGNTWPDEAAKWEHLRNVEVSPVLGTVEERKAALKRPANVFAINYDNLPWLVEHYGSKWPFRKIVSDEATRLKGFRLQQGGKRAQQLARVAHTLADYFFELTGTPSPNGLKDLWGQVWFLDRGERLGRTYTAFKDRWFQRVTRGERIDIEPLPFAQAEIEARLRDICLSLDARDYFDIAEPITNTIRVELPAAARRMYREMEREMFLALSDGTAIEAFNAASKTIKCLQLANGAIYTDGTGEAWAEVHDAKLQALDSIITEAAGMPVLVAYHFKSDRERIRRAFGDGVLDVGTDEGLRAAKRGKGRVWIGHPASMGHGVDGLQYHTNIVAFFGHWWDLEQRLQIIERIGPTRQAQAGQDRPVFIHNIVAADTTDEIVIARHDTKREVQDLLLEAMKRRA
ncbi:DEAD/DEAH box helicase [Bordetella hinzii]|uniref:DEAD/DEAH box helicase n=1 Tax=Bordetella hinzii TaxID=103855 RepID=UPI0013EFD0ED|nr:DEAD/DEAH box helicase [Bordetella hinzii]QII84205.1 DEAD/DEAH box helicase [Bordetella hinzii]